MTEFPNVEQLNELMIIGPITIRSACSHHLCPILGKLWIGVLPNEHSNLIGLSKYSRLADWVMSRPQIQEEAVTHLADLLQDTMNPDGLALVMEADHFCMQWRGVKDNDSKMINSVMRGSFLKDPACAPNFCRCSGIVAVDLFLSATRCAAIVPRRDRVAERPQARVGRARVDFGTRIPFAVDSRAVRART